MTVHTKFTMRTPRAWAALLLLLVTLPACANLPWLAELLDDDYARVVRIVDGDTIVVELAGTQETVRYIGIDTPERGEPGYDAATEANRALVETRRVRLVRDISDRDRFDRLLRFVYLEDGTHVNGALVSQGWAMPVEYPPDTRRATEFRRLAVAAAEQQQGFWRGESSVDGVRSVGLVTRAATLRSGPATSFAASGNVAAETPVTVFGRSANSRWLQVRLPDRSGGWLAVDAVRLNVPVATLPVREDGATAAPTATAEPPALCPSGCEVQPISACVVKGNVGSSGDRIYHLPGGSSYAQVVIRPEQGDRWFCTIAEAEANGFRAPRR